MCSVSTLAEVEPSKITNGACLLCPKVVFRTKMGLGEKVLGLGLGRGQPWPNTKQDIPLSLVRWRIIPKYIIIFLGKVSSFSNHKFLASCTYSLFNLSIGACVVVPHCYNTFLFCRSLSSLLRMKLF